MRPLAWALWLVGSAATAQNIITTIAGTDVSIARTSRAIETQLGEPAGLAFDARGDLLIADTASSLLFRVRGGEAEVIAGTGIPAFAVNIGEDIPAASATLAGLRDVTMDAGGAPLVLNNGVIRRILSTGLIRTVVGEGETGSIGTAHRIVADRAGNLFVVELFRHRVRKLSAGSISAFAGSGDPGFSGDGGQAANAQLRQPSAAAADPDGTLYIADTGNGRLRRVSPDGTIQTIATAQPNEITAVAVEPGGSVLFGGRFLRRRTREGTIQDVIPLTDAGFAGDGGPANAARIALIRGIAVNGAGEIFIADTPNRRVRMIGTNGQINTVVGSGSYRASGDGGPASAAPLSEPGKITVDPAGTLYFADRGNRRVRRIGVNGVIAPVAGTGASLLTVEGVAADARGNVYVSDPRQNRVWRLEPGGRAAPFAGTGTPGFSGDGAQATAARLDSPGALAFAADGSLLIADQGNFRVRQVLPNGDIRTLAGNGNRGSLGDGGGPLQAQLDIIRDIAADRSGGLYIATDTIAAGTPSRIRVVRDGRITTLVTFDASAEAVAVDGERNVYFADGCAVRRISAAGEQSTVAGQPNLCGSSGDGLPATQAALAAPSGLAIDGAGNLNISDRQSNRIRRVLVTQPGFSASPRMLTFTANSRGAPAAPQVLGLAGSINNVGFTVSIDDPGARWLSAEDPFGVTPRRLEITADPERLDPGVYEGTVRIETPFANPRQTTIPVRFEVGPPAPPALAIDKQVLTFAFPRQSAPRTEALILANVGSGPLPLAIVARSPGWLRVNPNQGVSTPRVPLQVNVRADPTGLSPGTYTGAVVIQSPGVRREVPVTLMVSDRDQAILISQSGLSFAAVESGGLPPPQQFAVLNTGTGAMTFRTSVSTLAGGEWLSVSAPAGSSEPGAPALLEAQVNHAGLPPGRYYGQVRVDSETAANTPHVLTVNLEVLRPDENPGAVLQPASLLFEPAQGGVPAAKEFMIYNLTPQPVSYRAFTSDIAVLPRDAVIEPNQPLRVLVQPITLSPASRRPGAVLQFSDGIQRKIPAALASESAPQADPKSVIHRADGCTARELVPAVLSLGQSQTVPAGWPAGVSVEVKDNCGLAMDRGSVTLNFSNGDPPLALIPLRDGKWHGTWQSRNASTSRVVVRVEAEQSDPGLKGVREVDADLRASTDPPAITAEGIVSFTAPVPFAPLAPGALIAINGERLTSGTPERASSAPLPVQLAGAEAVIAGRRMPLSGAADARIDAVVPPDVAPNTTHQILVRRGTSYSRPVPVNVAAAQPAIVTGADGLAKVVVNGNEATIECTGLGAVDPPVEPGAAAPADPRAVVKASVRVRFGGADPVAAAAVAMPGSVGVYLVAAPLPSNLAAGTRVAITVEAAGQASPAADFVR
ncbi:MAG: hypothetical protein FJW39_25265 [Acidobacteria bacterium]|nr:hypothetical protein [Acidobacteriota bacterium]